MKPWHILNLVILQVVLILLFEGCHVKKNPLPPEIFTKKLEHEGIVREENTFDNKTFLVVDLVQSDAEKKSKTLGQIQIFVPEKCSTVLNHHIRFFTKISEIRSFQNPGVFNYKTHLNRQNIWGKTFVKTCDHILTIQKTELGFFKKIRTRIETDIEHYAKKYPKILKQVSLGTKDTDPLYETLIRKTGLSHLFVISGLHFSMMAFVLFGLAGLIWQSLPMFLKNFPKQKFASLVTLLFVFCYITIAENHPSLRRSGIMIAAYLFAILFEKQTYLLHIILVSLFLNLLIAPMDVFSLSCQLSYLCVFLLALMLPYLKEHLSFLKNFKKPIRLFLELVLSTICLTVFLMPLLSLHFEELALSGIFHNLWAIPVFQIFVMPLVMAILFFSGFFLPFTDKVILICDWMMDQFLILLKFLSRWQPEFFVSCKPHVEHVILFYVMIFSFVIFKKKLFTQLALTALLVSLCSTYFQNHLHDDLKIIQIDVGQGDAILIQRKKKNILIDTGGHYYLDIGELVLTPYFRHKWIKALDLVILTHSDTDHYLGLNSLLEKIPIKEVWINPFPSEEVTYKALLQKLKEKNITVTTVTAPKQVFLDHQTSLKILSPSLEETLSSKDNDRSLIVQLIFKNFKALFPGDISKLKEKDLIKNFESNLRSDFLKVSHHGSKSSTTSEFLNAVQPRIASIGVAQRSRFGHPSKKVLDRLQNVSAVIYRTDHHGAIEYTVKREKIKIHPFVGKGETLGLKTKL